MFHAPRLLHLGPLHGRPLVDLRAHARHVVLALPAAGLDVPHRRLLSFSPLLTLYTLNYTKLYTVYKYTLNHIIYSIGRRSRSFLYASLSCTCFFMLLLLHFQLHNGVNQELLEDISKIPGSEGVPLKGVHLCPAAPLLRRQLVQRGQPWVELRPLRRVIRHALLHGRSDLPARHISRTVLPKKSMK